jgi:RNase H-fold protein (predicted Holliday junction resolvase)
MNTTASRKSASKKTSGDLSLAFDVGHSSIGWAVLQANGDLGIKAVGQMIASRANAVITADNVATRGQHDSGLSAWNNCWHVLE